MAIPVIGMIAAGAYRFWSAPEEPVASQVDQPGSTSEEHLPGPTSGSDGGAEGESIDETSPDLSRACRGIVSAAPDVGDYIVIVDHATTGTMEQALFTRNRACRRITRTAGRIAPTVRMLDSSDYWGLNIDNGRVQVWTAFTGPYGIRSQAAAVQAGIGSGSEVRRITPCDKGFGEVCS